MAEQRPNQHDFIRLGPQWHIGVRPEDRSGAGDFLSYECQGDLLPGDTPSMMSRCTVRDEPMDGLYMRSVWDGTQFPQPQWRTLHARVKAFVRWLATPPEQRSAKFDP